MSESNMFPRNGSEDVRHQDDALRINDSFDSKESKVYASKKLSRFFELEVSLKIFGEVIFHWVFPPVK